MAIHLFKNGLSEPQFSSAGIGLWHNFPLRGAAAFEARHVSGVGTIVLEIHGTNDITLPPSPSSLMMTLIVTNGSDPRASETKPEPAYEYMCVVRTDATAGAVAIVSVSGK